MTTGPIASRWFRRETLLFGMLVLALGWHFFTVTSGASFSREPEGYYNLQTAGFLQGHLHAAVKPHPELLALPDPYDPVANAPYRMHDMTLWKGKYYLYFGVAPILLLFLPVRLLSGFYILEPTAVALFVTLGLGFATMALAEIRRAFFPKAGYGVLFLLVLAQGLAAPSVLLTLASQFYQVPIACAYALSMIGLWCLQKMWLGEVAHRRSWFWAASSCFALTLAARPNYILAMALLLKPLHWCWREHNLRESSWREKLSWALAAFGPVAAVGCGLLFYNWARFGSPGEFGMRYQLAGQSFVNFSPLGLQHLIPHLTKYLWTDIRWQPYFPFVEIGALAPYGILHYLPLVWLVVVAVWPLALPGETRSRERMVLTTTIAILGAANLVMNSLFFGEPTVRYLCDFAPVLLFLGAIGGLALAHMPFLRPVTHITVGVSALWSIMITSAVFIHWLPPHRYPATTAKLANSVVAKIERWQGRQHGGVRLKIQLPANPTKEFEPICQTGATQDRRNWLQLHYRENNTAQLGFFHAGIGELLSEEFPIPADRSLILDLYSGAFLPPDTHPLYEGMSPEAISAARSKLEIRLNDRVILTACLTCYPSRPWDLLVGKIGHLPYTENLDAEGQVTKLSELPLVSLPLPARSLSGIDSPQVIELQLPAHLAYGFEPLLATGVPGKGELLYLIYYPEHKIQFGLDSLNGRGTKSAEITYDPTKIQKITVWLGSWAQGPSHTQPANETSVPNPGNRRLYVALNDTVVLNEQQEFSASRGIPSDLGWNRIGAGSAAEFFSGRILSIKAAPAGAIPPPRDPAQEPRTQ